MRRKKADFQAESTAMSPSSNTVLAKSARVKMSEIHLTDYR